MDPIQSAKFTVQMLSEIEGGTILPLRDMPKSTEDKQQLVIDKITSYVKELLNKVYPLKKNWHEKIIGLSISEKEEEDMEIHKLSIVVIGASKNEGEN